MSYCRFSNTVSDLKDCQEALEELMNDASAKPLSRGELRSAKDLATTCLQIVQLLASNAPSGAHAGAIDLMDIDEEEFDRVIQEASINAGVATDAPEEF